MENPVDSTTNNQTITAKQKFEGKVLKTTLQGAIVDIGSQLPAFLHVSQVVDPENIENVITNLDEILKVDQVITVWVKRVLKDHYELTMREPLMYEWRELAPEMTVHGKVVRLESFGAFVEIGAERPGLVHVSELSHNFVRLPSEVVKVGDEVEVKILEVNRRKKQIKLSMKALQDSPEEIMAEFTQPRRKGKGKKEVIEVEEEEVIPDPTFMEIAMRKAMDRAEQRRPEIASRIKKQKNKDTEADDIFERTLTNKLSNAGDLDE
ncbi:MAG: S1 RNA-binding domain-containing protein [Anaerolineaceae bacterium]|jgi:ribosomal protein S1|nr:S1 RNA-binding domain-containing protein [Anaerolineaceae bacterium]MDD4043161.1 S1 RNA-binding domain-containing protein [Anaerolineaceae bacterium]MDD4577632.1 S1 RNA-binding domain-containing protein [Anaerolineaceae bacterium]